MDPFPGRQCVFLGITHGIDPSEDTADVILKVAYNTSAENSAEEGRLRPRGEEESAAAPTAWLRVLCLHRLPLNTPAAEGCLDQGVLTMRARRLSRGCALCKRGQARRGTCGLHESEQVPRVQGTSGVREKLAQGQEREGKGTFPLLLLQRWMIAE